MSLTPPQPTFDELRDHQRPCVECGHVVTGSPHDPPCRDIATCRHRDGSASNRWRSWWSGRRGQPDSHEGGIE